MRSTQALGVCTALLLGLVGLTTPASAARASGALTARQALRPAATSLSIVVAKNALLPGAITTVRGRLHGGSPEAVASRRVVLLSQDAGAGTWQLHDARRTDRAGKVHFLIRPRTHVRYRLAFAGARGLQPSRSAVVEVRMRPVVTVAAEPRRLDPGQSTTISGTVIGESGAVAGATVDLLARISGRDGGWVVVASTTTAADGSASLLVTPTTTTSYRLRSNAVGEVPAGRSAPVRVQVRSASALSIRGETTADGLVVLGRLLAPGRSARGQVVTLETYDAASMAWRPVTASRTDRKGRVRFLQPLGTATSYRLSYDGPRFAASTSATLTG